MAARLGVAFMVATVDRHSTVQRNQQVEALLLTHLPDDDARGTHPQCLLDQAAERDLPGALQAGLATLHRGDVSLGDLQLEDLLARDDALSRRNGSRQAVEQGRL